MKRHSQILAGTALGLLMASAPLAALPLPETNGIVPAGERLAQVVDGQVILAQATPATEETEEERLRREAEEAAGEAEAPAAAEEPVVEEEAPATAEEPAAAPEAPVTAEEPAAAPDAPATAEQPVEEEAPATAEEPAAAPEAPVTAEEPAAAPEAPVAAEEPVEEEAPATAEEPAAAPAAPATAEEPAAAPEAPATAGEPVEEQDPATAEEPASAPETPATAEEPAADPAAPATAEDPAAPADAEAAEGEPAQGNVAPLTDSAKEAPAEGTEGEQAAQPAPADAAPPPESDAAAQSEEITAEEVESITAEEGQRLDAEENREETREQRAENREERRARREERREERRERRENARVIEEFDDNRVIIEIGGQIIIESPDYERIIFDDDEVYYEELSQGRTREVIIREDGVRIVTVRNRYGDVIRRSKIFPDDREVVLVYVQERYYGEVVEFRDPGANLPPLVLSIPRDEYILEAELVDDPDRYYAFLDQPPVEQIERTYSLAEVKRSARIRDTMRRVDLDTINFEFGSAQIEESEIDELEGVATAMERMLEENPGETFLIEGHTDAVGSDLANLALSDQRAEAVATALTDVFAIPPENLTTQGYGEQYLKIETEERARENRRVAIRRITPLVTPVASAE